MEKAQIIIKKTVMTNQDTTKVLQQGELRSIFKRFRYRLKDIFIITLDLESTPGDTLSLRGEIMKIAEVSERYGVSSDTLRYYERIGLIPPVNRSESGIRDYNGIDVRRVEFIKCMRGAGLPIEALIEYVRLVQQGDQTIVARMKEMQKTNDYMDE
jgi:DNA-binding transcriptional MerR regulator